MSKHCMMFYPKLCHNSSHHLRFNSLFLKLQTLFKILHLKFALIIREVVSEVSKEAHFIEGRFFFPGFRDQGFCISVGEPKPLTLAGVQHTISHTG